MADGLLYALLERQKQQTRTFLGKLWQFFRIVFLRYPNEFEQYLLRAEPNDSSFVAKYSEVRTLDTTHVQSVSVPSVSLRCLHAPHPLVNFAKVEPMASEFASQLDESPALIFLHGMGGQMSQFESLMGLLSQCSEIYALDLPGFGDSRVTRGGKSSLDAESQELISKSIGKMKPSHFSTACIVDLIVQYIAQTIPPHKKLILIGHSMGTHLSIKVTCRLPPRRVEGLVLLAPPALKDDVHVTHSTWFRAPRMLTLFSWFPFVFNWFRVWDRLEGVASQSVLRQLPANSSLDMRLRQLRWNLDVDSQIVLSYARHFTPCKTSEFLSAISRFNDNPHDKRAYEKILLIGGLEDRVTPYKVVEHMQEIAYEFSQRRVAHVTPVKGAGHSLLLSKPEFISGIILNHLESEFPERLHLSPAWVLKLKALISGDKWGLKNELKWSQTQSVSYNIIRRADGVRAPLLGMKTLREGDPVHSPSQFERRFYKSEEESESEEIESGTGQTEEGGMGQSVQSKYGHSGTTNTSDSSVPDVVDNMDKKNNLGKVDKVGVDTADTSLVVSGKLVAIVDISADIPPYSPKAFQHIHYYKCATVSKVVPDTVAVRRFIQLIDDILAASPEEDALVAVHCHYGFNRTGYLICCYLIERLGWSVQDALEGFKTARPPGIKHPHFVDALYVKYES